MSTQTQANSDERWRFLRDFAVFQLKMLLDNARDLVLMPVALVAAVIDLLLRGDREGARFYRVCAGAGTARRSSMFTARSNMRSRARSRSTRITRWMA